MYNAMNMKANTTKICKTAGKIVLYPFVWYVRTAAKNYEHMFGEDIKYFRFWM